MCPDCPVLAPLNHTKVVHAADAALKAYNTQTNGSYFQLVEVTRANIGVRLRLFDKLGSLVALRECTWWGAEQVQGQQQEGKEDGEKSPGE